MRFLPLTMAEMGGDGICVAGIDVDSSAWIRPVRKGYGCLFVEQAQHFEANSLHRLTLSPRQARSDKRDPLGRHTEDRILLHMPSEIMPIRPDRKLAILDGTLDWNLLEALLTQGRSLFLVRPEKYCAELVSADEWRWSFEVSGLSTRQLRSNRDLESALIGISGKGCKCTCPAWRRFAERTLKGGMVKDSDIARLKGSPTLFLTLSLSALQYEKYWLIAAGVHIVGEDRIWL